MQCVKGDAGGDKARRHRKVVRKIVHRMIDWDKTVVAVNVPINKRHHHHVKSGAAGDGGAPASSEADDSGPQFRTLIRLSEDEEVRRKFFGKNYRPTAPVITGGSGSVVAAGGGGSTAGGGSGQPREPGSLPPSPTAASAPAAPASAAKSDTAPSVAAEMTGGHEARDNLPRPHGAITISSGGGVGGSSITTVAPPNILTPATSPLPAIASAASPSSLSGGAGGISRALHTMRSTPLMIHAIHSIGGNSRGAEGPIGGNEQQPPPLRAPSSPLPPISSPLRGRSSLGDSALVTGGSSTALGTAAELGVGAGSSPVRSRFSSSLASAAAVVIATGARSAASVEVNNSGSSSVTPAGAISAPSREGGLAAVNVVATGGAPTQQVPVPSQGTIITHAASFDGASSSASSGSSSRHRAALMKTGTGLLLTTPATSLTSASATSATDAVPSDRTITASGNVIGAAVQSPAGNSQSRRHYGMAFQDEPSSSPGLAASAASGNVATSPPPVVSAVAMAGYGLGGAAASSFSLSPPSAGRYGAAPTATASASPSPNARAGASLLLSPSSSSSPYGAVGSLVGGGGAVGGAGGSLLAALAGGDNDAELRSFSHASSPPPSNSGSGSSHGNYGGSGASNVPPLALGGAISGVSGTGTPLRPSRFSSSRKLDVGSSNSSNSSISTSGGKGSAVSGVSGLLPPIQLGLAGTSPIAILSSPAAAAAASASTAGGSRRGGGAPPAPVGIVGVDDADADDDGLEVEHLQV